MHNLKDNKIQFAVVREDPEIEIAIVTDHLPAIKKILLIGSAGCTAMALRNHFPLIKQTLVEPNQAQINLIKEKEVQILNGDLQKLIDLNQHGNFESLFRQLREFFYEFIISEEKLSKAILTNNQEVINAIIKHKYWPVGFDLFFSDSILNTMFGPDATQHAEVGSYPAYFRTVYEMGLKRADSSSNYFLHHLLLSNYNKSNLPQYFTTKIPHQYTEFEIKNCLIHEIDDFSHYDLMSFSNIFDWASVEYIDSLASRIKKESKSGSIIIFRQLNNSRDFKKLFSPEYSFDQNLENELLKKDRSLFYSKFNIGKKL
jgi:S-adenosylmethionine-diacylglycerol 3-amino-3-carboxypropyl transferase